MGFGLRKLFVWVVSLGALLAIFLLYNRISKSPQIDFDTETEFIDTVDESNAGEFGSEIGTIGDVEVTTLKKTKFLHRNKNKEVDREFGFEELLHEEGDEWQVEKPYMNIFQHSFKCYITADKGEVQLETVAGRTSPKNATLLGNVVIHILPENSSDIRESFIYLDDVVFISDKSQFSTAGPVKFTSQDARMLGRGLELVYNNELDRLEFLRIIHLESLNLVTSSRGSLFSSPERDIDTSVGTGSRVQTDQPAKSAPADVPQKTEEMRAAGRQGEHYRCVFSKNVVIEAPGQLIFAHQVSINNIFPSKSSSRKSNKAETINKDNGEINNVTVAKQSEPNESPEEFVDIAVTCDGGIVITPMDSARADSDSGMLSSAGLVATGGEELKSLKVAGGRTVLVAQKIDYCASTRDTVATGPLELTFYVNDIMGAEAETNSVPVKATARKDAKFLDELNQVIFEGDCLCTMDREDPNIQQEYTLSAPKLTVSLSRDKTSATDIEHLTANGGVVRLATIKTAEEKLLGGIELKCRKFDFDTDRQLFLATGPGLIALDNSNISEPNSEVGKFSFNRPSWAFVRDFDTLKYFLEANKVIADAAPQGTLRIDYFPVVQGQYGQQATATAGHIEALLYETLGGQTELSTLTATGGIHYEEEHTEFDGNQLFYDANRSILTVQGDEVQPCYYNGVLVDAIEHDLKTGKVSFEITGPGVLQRRR